MKNLILLMAVLIFDACNQEKEVQDYNWNKVGYINPDNPCEFIINDSVSIIGSVERGGDYSYALMVKGKKVNIKPSLAWQSTYDSRNDMIRSIQRRYKTYLEERRLGVFYSSNYVDCN